MSYSEEELPEIETLVRSGAAPMKAQGGVESKQGKANVLIQVRRDWPAGHKSSSSSSSTGLCLMSITRFASYICQ
jgi:hypothetical protein